MGYKHKSDQEYQREYYLKRKKKPEYKEYLKTYYERNREHILQLSNDYYYNNKNHNKGEQRIIKSNIIIRIDEDMD